MFIKENNIANFLNNVKNYKSAYPSRLRCLGRKRPEFSKPLAPVAAGETRRPRRNSENSTRSAVISESNKSLLSQLWSTTGNNRKSTPSVVGVYKPRKLSGNKVQNARIWYSDGLFSLLRLRWGRKEIEISKLNTVSWCDCYRKIPFIYWLISFAVGVGMASVF